ncbi:hypothetical protein B0H34DRAFT_793447 [Crassisporium funariophilum]|nr:hypothetical protein B0H34DRAFT_793447 [Crassisporium funariophilum]
MGAKSLEQEASSSTVIVDERTKIKKSRKARNERAPVLIHDDQPQPQAASVAEDVVMEEATIDLQAQGKQKEKKKKVQPPATETEVVASPSKKDKKRKNADVEEQQEQEATVADIIEEPTKKGKRKLKRARNQEELDESGKKPAEEEEAEEEPPKKKHKNKTSFADPREDKELNNQSRKALEYAFTQMNRPSKWKFNKARQNWLIRNVWSPDFVPESYFPLVTKYLTNVQGGSRDKLKETCQTYIAAKDTPEAVVPSSTATTTTTTPADSAAEPTATPATTKLTPGPLIAAPSQPTPGALVPIAVPLVSILKSGPTPDNALAEVRRTRARCLLDSLADS